ncbi:hypothetical protein ABIE67_005916 [Streptomyces sp. V4I8]|uniref:hypothetical protein n=1 Tax=Streptomyces sp. V4I8 TaxID=3156469 RepID=UPI003516599D
MSRPPERANGTPQRQPNVYHPQASASPAYEAYADPAAAHGWQNAYDETAELPRVGEVGTAEGAAGGSGESASTSTGAGAGSGAGAGARHGRRAGGAGRGVRRKRRSWGPGRAVVVVGAAGVVSAAALIAGFSFSGSSPEGDSRGKHDRTGPTVRDSADPTDPTDGNPATPDSSDGSGSSRTQAPDASPSVSASASATATATAEDGKADSPSPTPSTTSAAPSTPTATASTTAPGGGRDDKPGRGPGNTKGPK